MSRLQCSQDGTAMKGGWETSETPRWTDSIQSHIHQCRIRRKQTIHGESQQVNSINICSYYKFGCREFEDTLKTCRGKDSVEDFFDCIEMEVKQLCNTFLYQQMSPLADIREHRCKKTTHEYEHHICVKSFDDLLQSAGSLPVQWLVKNAISEYILILCHGCSGNDAHLFIIEFSKKLNIQGIGFTEKQGKYIIKVK